MADAGAVVDQALDLLLKVDVAALRGRHGQLVAAAAAMPNEAKALRDQAAAVDAQVAAVQTRLGVLEKIAAVLAAPASPAAAPAGATTQPGADVDQLIDAMMKLDPKAVEAKTAELKTQIAKLQSEAASARQQADAVDARLADAQKRIALLGKLIAAFEPPAPTTAPANTAGAAGAGDATMASAAAAATPTVNYREHVFPILAERCVGCHNPDKARGGLVMDTYSALMQGGGGGAVVRPGDPDGSRLLRLASHVEEPAMPPLESRLADDRLAVIRDWIAQGAASEPGSAAAVAAASGPPKKRVKSLVSVSNRKGPPIMPANLPELPAMDAPNPAAARAMAVSPVAPLLAVSSTRRVLLYDLSGPKLLGALAFDEGTPQCLRFSVDGRVLVCGGGEAGKSGTVVLYDVETGDRLGDYGRAYDAVLAADLSPDGSLVAMGGPNRKVRVFDTDTGEPVYEIAAHNDWIYSVAFNLYGDLMATADRAGVIGVWEAQTGREVHVLRGHAGAVSALGYTGESDLLVSTGEDGTVRVWEMEEGRQTQQWKAHDEASLGLAVVESGRLATGGADRRVRVWQPDGKPVSGIDNLGDWVYGVALAGDGSQVAAGTWDGSVGVWEAETGKEIARLSAGP